MLDISKSARFFILALSLFALLCTGISYHRKISSSPKPGTINIDENYTLIDINKASATQLESLTGIGVKLAENIIAYREAIGGFKNIEEIKNVKGIGRKKFEKIKDLINISE